MDVFWQPWSGPGAEHLRLVRRPDGSFEAGGTMIRSLGDAPIRVDYIIRCDDAWRTERAEVSCGERHILLGAASIAALDCIDVDIMGMTFTNTLPIRRLQLKVGASAQIAAAFVVVPDLVTRRERQRYTRLSENEYRYEGLGTGFTSVLTVDDEGIVIDYPQLSRRIWPRDILPAPRK